MWVKKSFVQAASISNWKIIVIGRSEDGMSILCLCGIRKLGRWETF